MARPKHDVFSIYCSHRYLNFLKLHFEIFQLIYELQVYKVIKLGVPYSYGELGTWYLYFLINQLFKIEPI